MQDWYRRGKRFLVSPRENISMFAIVEGNGPETLILIHGIPSSSYEYYYALPLLAKEFTVVAFDLPGFGFSDKPQEVEFSQEHHLHPNKILQKFFSRGSPTLLLTK